MSREQQVHLKGLNGIRAIAALAVVVSHTLQFSKHFGLPVNTGIDLAGFGVTIFFSLSGFLITYLLLLEKQKFSTINIKAFYFRRILRIWPLYYFYLLLCVIVIIVFHLVPLPGPLIYYIILCAYVPFISGTDLPSLGHYWSLGVEEQFYLFWPWIVKNANNLIKFLLIFIACFLLAKVGLRIFHSKTGILWPYTLIHVCRFECMAIGALGAVFFFRDNLVFKKIAFNPLAQILAWAMICLMAVNRFHIASIIDSDIVAVVTVILIVNVAANKKSIIKLDFGIFNFLGKISYGIYVYHPLILAFSVEIIGQFLRNAGSTEKYLLLFLYVFILTVLVAWLSYNLFEKRFLMLKSKFALIKSSS